MWCIVVALPECIISACVFLSYHTAYMNYLSFGTAVIEVGNNLHLILPEGAFPLSATSSSSPVTSVLTPVSPVHMSSVSVKQTYHPAAVTPLQRYRATAPLLIPAPIRKPMLTSAAAHSSPAASTQPAAHAAADKVRLEINLHLV